MMQRREPRWFAKAREIAAKLPVPPKVQAKKGEAAKLYLYDAIGFDPWSGTGIEPKDVVASLEEAKGAELEVHVNSPGGYVFDGLSIYNAIRTYSGQKTVYVDGLAASIASIIALAGDKVVTNEGGMWMVHDPMGGMMVWGTADEIEESARKEVAALRKARENLTDIYVRATGKPVSEVSGWMTAETWMTADEALARGFTDEVSKSEPTEAEPEPRKAAVAPVRIAAQMRQALDAMRRDTIVEWAASRVARQGRTGPAPTK